MKPPSFELLLIVARGIALLLSLFTIAWALVRWRRDTSRDNQRVFEQLDLVRAELMQLQEQVGSLPAPQTVTPERRSPPEQQRIINVPTNAAPRGYEVAARLARSGATCSELVSSCGLSRHEAELLLRLHSPTAAKTQATAARATASTSQSASRPVAGQMSKPTATQSKAPSNNWNSNSNASYASATRATAHQAATQVAGQVPGRATANASRANQPPVKASANSASAPTNRTPVAAKPTYQSRLSLVG